MSFYLGISSKDLVALAADRKHWNENKYYDGQKKLLPLGPKIYGVVTGWEVFGNSWLMNFRKHSGHSSFEVLGKFLRITYACTKFIFKLTGRKIEGHSGIAIAGFSFAGDPFIASFESVEGFKPQICHNGSIYCNLSKNSERIKDFIRKISRESFQIQNVWTRKAFLKDNIEKIFLELSKKFENISAIGDIVFITPEGSNHETLNDVKTESS